MSAIGIIRKDPQYKKFSELWTRLQRDFDVDSTVSECHALHTSRLSTQIKDSKGQFSPQMLLEASAVDLSNRSRMSFLAANLQLRLSKFKSALEAIDNYINNKYCAEAGFRTIDERKKFCRRVLKEYIMYYEKGAAALEFVEALIKDIDQAGYNLRNMVDCLKLLSETKGKII